MRPSDGGIVLLALQQCCAALLLHCPILDHMLTTPWPAASSPHGVLMSFQVTICSTTHAQALVAVLILCLQQCDDPRYSLALTRMFAPPFTAPSSSPSGVILPPIPKYARRHNATTLPISQQLVPGPGLSHANTHLATYPNSTNYPYAHSQHVPASSQAGTSITAAAPLAASVPSPHSQQPLIAATEGGGPAPGSQVRMGLRYL